MCATALPVECFTWLPILFLHKSTTGLQLINSGFPSASSQAISCQRHHNVHRGPHSCSPCFRPAFMGVQEAAREPCRANLRRLSNIGAGLNLFAAAQAPPGGPLKDHTSASQKFKLWLPKATHHAPTVSGAPKCTGGGVLGFRK